MLKKTATILIKNNLYTTLLRTQHSRDIQRSTLFLTLSSLESTPVDVIKNTGQFFPGLTLFFLGLSTLPFSNFYKLTLKSTIFSTWNLIAAYNYIF